ncbi:unnamed protein product [Pleuronectes platessa]|uniref:Uncharacterized protein n=1 Tax=Pleuronectes platessa TaxID=8262 RepID=A0A9N7UG12_PLEPL|nr:unnamed protein product [Pleuronectes platessa]
MSSIFIKTGPPQRLKKVSREMSSYPKKRNKEARPQEVKDSHKDRDPKHCDSSTEGSIRGKDSHSPGPSGDVNSVEQPFTSRRGESERGFTREEPVMSPVVTGNEVMRASLGEHSMESGALTRDKQTGPLNFKGELDQGPRSAAQPKAS